MSSTVQRDVRSEKQGISPARWRLAQWRSTIDRPHRPLAARAVLAAGVLLAACGSDEPTTEGNNGSERGEIVEALGTDRLRFEPNGFTIPAGQEVTLELTAASVEHDFVVEGAADVGTAEADHPAEEADDLHVAHADPDETVTADFMIDEAGTYAVYCSVPGHREAGMVASLEVVDAPQ